MVVLKLIVLHQTVVSDADTSSRIESTLYQKQLITFCQKAQNFVQFGLYEFCSQTIVWYKIQILIKKYMESPKLSMSASAIVI